MPYFTLLGPARADLNKAGDLDQLMAIVDTYKNSTDALQQQMLEKGYNRLLFESDFANEASLTWGTKDLGKNLQTKLNEVARNSNFMANPPGSSSGSSSGTSSSTDSSGGKTPIVIPTPPPSFKAVDQTTGQQILDALQKLGLATIPDISDDTKRNDTLKTAFETTDILFPKSSLVAIVKTLDKTNLSAFDGTIDASNAGELAVVLETMSVSPKPTITEYENFMNTNKNAYETARINLTSKSPSLPINLSITPPKEWDAAATILKQLKMVENTDAIAQQATFLNESALQEPENIFTRSTNFTNELNAVHVDYLNAWKELFSKTTDVDNNKKALEAAVIAFNKAYQTNTIKAKNIDGFKNKLTDMQTMAKNDIKLDIGPIETIQNLSKSYENWDKVLAEPWTDTDIKAQLKKLFTSIANKDWFKNNTNLAGITTKQDIENFEYEKVLTDKFELNAVKDLFDKWKVKSVPAPTHTKKKGKKTIADGTITEIINKLKEIGLTNYAAYNAETHKNKQTYLDDAFNKTDDLFPDIQLFDVVKSINESFSSASDLFSLPKNADTTLQMLAALKKVPPNKTKFSAAIQKQVKAYNTAKTDFETEATNLRRSATIPSFDTTATPLEQLQQLAKTPKIKDLKKALADDALFPDDKTATYPSLQTTWKDVADAQKTLFGSLDKITEHINELKTAVDTYNNTPIDGSLAMETQIQALESAGLTDLDTLKTISATAAQWEKAKSGTYEDPIKTSLDAFLGELAGLDWAKGDKDITDKNLKAVFNSGLDVSNITALHKKSSAATGSGTSSTSSSAATGSTPGSSPTAATGSSGSGTPAPGSPSTPSPGSTSPSTSPADITEDQFREFYKAIDVHVLPTGDASSTKLSRVQAMINGTDFPKAALVTIDNEFKTVSTDNIDTLISQLNTEITWNQSGYEKYFKAIGSENIEKSIADFNATESKNFKKDLAAYTNLGDFKPQLEIPEVTLDNVNISVYAWYEFLKTFTLDDFKRALKDSTPIKAYNDSNFQTELNGVFTNYVQAFRDYYADLSKTSTDLNDAVLKFNELYNNSKVPASDTTMNTVLTELETSLTDVMEKDLLDFKQMAEMKFSYADWDKMIQEFPNMPENTFTDKVKGVLTVIKGTDWYKNLTIEGHDEVRDAIENENIGLFFGSFDNPMEKFNELKNAVTKQTLEAEQVKKEAEIAAAKQTAEEAAAKKAAEEARQKAEEEARQKAEKEARQKAEKEARQKAEKEAAAKKAAEKAEAKKAAEEAEAAKKAAEEAEAAKKAAEEAKKDAINALAETLQNAYNVSDIDTTSDPYGHLTDALNKLNTSLKKVNLLQIIETLAPAFKDTVNEETIAAVTTVLTETVNNPPNEKIKALLQPAKAAYEDAITQYNAVLKASFDTITSMDNTLDRQNLSDWLRYGNQAEALKNKTDVLQNNLMPEQQYRNTVFKKELQEVYDEYINNIMLLPFADDSNDFEAAVKAFLDKYNASVTGTSNDAIREKIQGIQTAVTTIGVQGIQETLDNFLETSRVCEVWDAIYANFAAETTTNSLRDTLIAKIQDTKWYKDLESNERISSTEFTKFLENVRIRNDNWLFYEENNQPLAHIVTVYTDYAVTERTFEDATKVYLSLDTICSEYEENRSNYNTFMKDTTKNKSIIANDKPCAKEEKKTFEDWRQHLLHMEQHIKAMKGKT